MNDLILLLSPFKMIVLAKTSQHNWSSSYQNSSKTNVLMNWCVQVVFITQKQYMHNDQISSVRILCMSVYTS